jgi:N4-gp56 family major capsid protein
MAQTNFPLATGHGAKILWSRQVWDAARDMMFINRFTGGSDAVIQKITELTKQERGETVRMQLVADLVSDGQVGDGEREGNEEQLQNYVENITIDIINNGVRNTGKLSDQKSVLNFREQAKDKLAYWLANRMDQLAFLTLSGIAYTFDNDGGTRSDTAFSNLAFASDVSAPTTNRWQRVTADGSSVYTGLAAGATASVDATDILSYKAIVDAMTYADRHYLPPLMSGGKPYYVGFVSPEGYAQLKKDDDFQRAVTSGETRGSSNPWFTGGVVTVDGLVLHPHRLVFNTLGAASGSKWGSSGTVDGSRMLICGRQALGMIDLGPPEWAEEEFEYKSQQGINIDKIFGLVKPKFYSIYDEAVEDFGVMALDHAI